jgi:folylpolyglutamate synthase/dihydropteroate synthase
MQTFLCQNIINLDAQWNYEAKDIQRLIGRAQVSDRATAIVIDNAHFLTTRAFVILYEYIQQRLSQPKTSKGVLLLIVSNDKSKIFPPLLEFVSS